MNKKRKNKTHENVILILTLGIFIFLVVLTIKEIISENKIDEGKVKIIERILTSIIAIVSVYIGSKIK